MRTSLSVRAVALIAVVALLVGVGIDEMISSDNIYVQMNKFKDILMMSEKFHVDEVSTEKLIDGAITGMLAELDPHSVYFPAKSFEKVTEEMGGSFQGVGLQITTLNDTVTVVEPMGGGPAIRLGVLANDRIVAVDDNSVVGVSQDIVSKKLRGPKGTKVRITIVRAGEPGAIEFEIIRDEIPLYSVDAAIMTDDETGYISVNRFNTKTQEEVMRGLVKLRSEGMKRLVLDLRGNPGGILQQAVRIADLFLEGGSRINPRRIVYTKARRPELSEEYFATNGQEFEKTPIVVLINNGSASASEIVAGAIQDWDRGIVVGETSFGKGLVQREWNLADGSAVRLTIARYYTPSGRLIQRDYTGKDLATYEREAFERDEKEGSNMDHTKEGKSADGRPVFHTNAGRTVYGGGGITPDYVVKQQPLTPQTQTMFRRDFFYQYVSAYLDGSGRNVRVSYGNDYEPFVRSFEVTEMMLDEYRAFVQKRGLTLKDDEFRKDLEYIKARLKANIARSLWGNEGWAAVMLKVDPQYKRAVMLFPEASRLAAAR